MTPWPWHHHIFQSSVIKFLSDRWTSNWESIPFIDSSFYQMKILLTVQYQSHVEVDLPVLPGRLHLYYIPSSSLVRCGGEKMSHHRNEGVMVMENPYPIARLIFSVTCWRCPFRSGSGGGDAPETCGGMGWSAC